MSESTDTQPLLSVRGLKKEYPIKNSALLPSNRKAVHAVDGIDLDLYEGETLGLVGESGCGKSTVGRLLVGVEKPTEGEILYKGENLASMGSRAVSDIRTELQMIFQDSYSSLNPRKRVYDILAEPMVCHKLCMKAEAPLRVEELLAQVGLPKSAARRYPHEFSGGQRQRIAIARALSLNPKIIVCDEPVSALDMSIQAQILNLLKALQDELGISYLFIAHGLAAVHYISRRTAVMYLGKIVETADGGELFKRPLHPYSQALIAAVPPADPTVDMMEGALMQGEVPSAIDLPEGCRFADRCPKACERCRLEEPELKAVSGGGTEGHLVACWNIMK